METLHISIPQLADLLFQTEDHPPSWTKHPLDHYSHPAIVPRVLAQSIQACQDWQTYFHITFHPTKPFAEVWHRQEWNDSLTKHLQKFELSETTRKVSIARSKLYVHLQNNGYAVKGREDVTWLVDKIMALRKSSEMLDLFHVPKTLQEELQYENQEKPVAPSVQTADVPQVPSVAAVL
jgi:hypothetical protein